MNAIVLRRSGLVQSVAYGCLLGVLSAAPAIALAATGLFPQAAKLADDVARGGGVPFALAGVIVWLLVVLIRGHAAPRRGGVLVCWFGTVIAWYALVPIWIGAIEAWNRCSFSGETALARCWQSFSGMTTAAAIVSYYGAVFTAPVVLPFLLLGAWLWVRHLHPAIAAEPTVSR